MRLPVDQLSLLELSSTPPRRPRSSALALLSAALLGGCFVDEPRNISAAASTNDATSTAPTSSEGASATSESDTGSTAETSAGAVDCDGYPLQLAMTPQCVVGTDITSEEWGHSQCVAQLGRGWRWLSFHESGGWSATGAWIDDVGVGERGWVYIKDQNAECFSSPKGLTWLRPAQSCLAACEPDDGLEGEGFDPHPSGQCNSYTGDTPCDLCRRMICVG